MRTSGRLLTGWLVAAGLVLGGLLSAGTAVPARAATLTEITGFGDNPGNLRMHLYVPDSVRTNPAVLVAMHGCGSSGTAFYSRSEFASLADRYGYIVIYPSASKKNGCFDTWSDASKVRGGRTDPVSIVSMVNHVLERNGGDPRRVFVTGSSAGGMETNAMLALYPDVFAAGSVYMGVPFGCFANEADYQPTGGASNCSGGRVQKTAQQWGDLVRQAYPGFTGERPKLQIWHGTADTLVNYAVFAQQISQWTNVFGVPGTPVSTDTPQSGWTRTRYANAGGPVRLEAISVAGAGHSLPSTGQAAYTIEFFGLNSTAPSTSSVPVTTVPVGTTTRPPVPPTITGPTTTVPTTTVPTTTVPAGAGCSATYSVANSWPGGFQATVTVTNSGSSAIRGWRVTWALAAGQSITNSWNATLTTGGGSVTASNASFNGALASGTSASFGFTGTQSGSVPAPVVTCVAT